MKKWIAAAAAAVSLLLGAPSAGAVTMGGAACPSGTAFNPMTDTDWNNMFPITVMGVQMGGNTNPPLMFEPPVCECPSVLFGFPSMGYGVTYWQPLYLAEVERTAGCLESLGGTSIFSSGASTAYSALNSEQAGNNTGGDSVTSRMQIHWYEYPIFSMLNMFMSSGCFNAGGYDLGYLTEIDYTWQDDTWAALFAPEGVFFTDEVLQASCSIDAVASSVGFPLSIMFWCQGGGGAVYPLSGNSQHNNSPFQMNNSILGKFLARQARLGLEWATIGPLAECYAHPTPIWIKEQYRINQVSPIPRRGNPLYVGGSEIGQYPTQTNYPTRESTVNLIWQGMQCCERMY